MANDKNWIIHCCTNGACDDCGTIERGYLEYACNAHTHGMSQYGHPDFQVVLLLPLQEIGRILNTFGAQVRNGASFHAGQLVPGIYLDCDVRLDAFEETGREVLRVVIPDKLGRFPENPECQPPYILQRYQTDRLHSDGECRA